jgi:hypothetical protein
MQGYRQTCDRARDGPFVAIYQQRQTEEYRHKSGFGPSNA